MSFHKLALSIGASALLLTACSSFNPFSVDDEADARAEEDRAGRIAMTLSDTSLEADPDLATMAVILDDSVAVDSWAQTGGRPSKSTGHVQAAPEFTVDWSRNIGAGTTRNRTLTSQPIASNGRIYILDAEQKVIAIDANSGSQIWSDQLKSGNRRDQRAFGGGIALSGDTLIVASGFGFVSALNAEDGSQIWKRELDAPMVGSPTVFGDRVFVSSNNNELYALSLTTGTTEWTDQAIAESARILSSPSPAAIEDLLVAPYSSGELIAYLSSNGSRLWSDTLSRAGRFTPIGQINDIAARPVLHRGLVFAASQSGLLAAIDGRTGQRVWAVPLGSTQAPVISGEFLFAISIEAELVCIEATTGRIVWVKQLEKYRNMEKSRGRISYSGPLLASGRVIVGSSEGRLIALSPQTGEEVGRLNLGGDAIFIEPIAYNGKVYVLNENARLYAIR